MTAPTLAGLLPPPRARFWRDRALRPAAQLVDLDRVRTNGRAAREALRGRPFFAVVKANAYGLGALPVARALAGIADGFAVATLEEGLELRTAGVAAPILLLSGCFPAQLPRVAAAQLELGAVSLELLQAAAAFVSAPGGPPLALHLKFDTGMGRLGLRPDQAALAREILDATPKLRLAGLYSHFSAGEAPEAAVTSRQLATWAAVRELFAGHSAPRHFANSDALAAGLAPGEGGRAGIALARGPAASNDAVSLVVYPLMAKTLPAGHAVGYGPDWTTGSDTRTAVLPVGYADGVPRAIAPRAWAFGAGERLRFFGRVSMDLTTIRFPDHATLETPVWLLGGDGPTAGDWAAWAGTIPYEILTGLDGRLLKLYFEGGRAVGLRMPRGGYENVAPGEWELA